jgi:Fe-S oxidoreductase
MVGKKLLPILGLVGTAFAAGNVNPSQILWTFIKEKIQKPAQQNLEDFKKVISGGITEVKDGYKIEAKVVSSNSAICNNLKGEGFDIGIDVIGNNEEVKAVVAVCEIQIGKGKKLVMVLPENVKPVLKTQKVEVQPIKVEKPLPLK